jgi:hypothetical protein
VVVAVVAMGVVEAAVDEVVDVIAVGDGGVAAVGAVDVGFVVSLVGVLALVGVFLADGDGVMLDLSVAGVFQAAVVEVIDVAFVADGDVAAAGAVLMRLAGVGGLPLHVNPFSKQRTFSPALAGVTALKTVRYSARVKYSFSRASSLLLRRS